MEPMTKSEAQEYAPQWGSLIHNGDPGYIMYTTIPPEAPEHRDTMVSYIKEHCMPIAAESDAGPDEENEYEYNDSQMLLRLVAYLESLTY